MRWYRRFFRREITERQLDAELRFHLDQKISDLVATGMTPEEARRRAQLEFGGFEQVKEECRALGGSQIIERFMQDMQYAVRMLCKNPSFTIVAAVTLAFGIGANTAIFSVINCILLKPLPYPRPESLVTVSHTAPGWKADLPASPSTYFIYREQNQIFETLASMQVTL